MSAEEIAAKWRKTNPKYATKGIVLLWGDEVTGWRDQLRNPETERPSAIAVDAYGRVFKAVGGDDYNGAKCWQLVAG